MFDNLSERLERSFKILKGEGKITEINVAETLKDVRKALLDADVNYKVAKNFTDTVKEKALGQNVLTAVKPSQLMVKIVHDELTQLMGGETSEINLDSKPAIILMSGLQGSGKTTFSGKLARMLKSKKNKKPLLVACDVYRPAAIEQLRVLAEQIDEVIFEEFKGTGNMELQLDRNLSNKRIFPAVNIVASSTRRDDLLQDKQTLDRMWILRKYLADMNPIEAMDFVKDRLEKTKDNDEFLMSMNS